MSVDLQSELTELRRQILRMGASVESRVRQAAAALIDHDVVTAREVRTGDDEIDEMDLDIEEECLRILALSQPVAGDLRFVLSVLRINTELERIGDCAKGIAKRVLALESNFENITLPGTVRAMCTYTLNMLSNALNALSRGDSELARQVRRDDDRVDDLQKEVFAWVQGTLPDQIDAMQSILDVLSIARKLERIADMATNISEDVIFLVEGEVIRHREKV